MHVPQESTRQRVTSMMNSIWYKDKIEGLQSVGEKTYFCNFFGRVGNIEIEKKTNTNFCIGQGKG